MQCVGVINQRERVGDSGEERERVGDSGEEREREWGIVGKKGREWGREWIPCLCGECLVVCISLVLDLSPDSC